MTTGTTRAIQCPKCATSYQVRTETTGRLKCKKCGAAFAVGGTTAQTASRARRQSTDRNDQKMAVRLMFVAGGLLLLIALIVVGLGGKSTPVSNPRPDDQRADRERTRRRPAIPDGYMIPVHPKTVQYQFLKALSTGDEATLRQLFLFEDYFAWAAHHYHWSDDNPNRYDKADATRKKALEDMAIDQIMSDVQLMEYLKKYLIPPMEDETVAAISYEHKADYGRWDYLVKDSKGADLFNIVVQVRIKAGLRDDPYTHGHDLANWGVWKVEVKYHVSSLQAEKPDRRDVDAIIGRKQKIEKAKRRTERRTASRGPREVDPEEQQPLEGTGGAQIAAAMSSIKKIVDPATSGPELYRARQTLIDMGKPAIPFLLNYLVNKDHKEHEDDILMAMGIITTLREITGESFGYGPPTAGAVAMMGGSGLAGATPEQRVRAVRRWFGWWKYNKKSWGGRKVEPDKDDGP